jgi:hypothetical protein
MVPYLLLLHKEIYLEDYKEEYVILNSLHCPYLVINERRI